MEDFFDAGNTAIKADVHSEKIFTGYTPLNYPKEKTVIDLFEEQVVKAPDNVALIFDELELSYNKINQLSNQFADYLRKSHHIKFGDFAGLMLERSEWMIIAILGILKAGGAYVPIAVDYPQDRINYLVENSGCKVLIDDEQIKTFKRNQREYFQENALLGPSPNDLMYCIYTSGSTGQPKGVLVEHGGVVNLIYSQQREFGVTEDERILQFSSISFDASVEQIWIALLNGAGLVIINQDYLTDVKALEKYIIEKRVSHIHAVPAYLSELEISNLSFVKRILSGGDVCPPNLAKKYASRCDFYNRYGPTEITVTALEYKVTAGEQFDDFVPIGKPLANTYIYIFDEQQHAVPFGSTGEIYIGGDGVTRGYLNRAELTAEKFIPDPFRPGYLIYRTGDLGAWLSDGNLKFLGRIDDQVKIRGFRIELGEISSALRTHRKVNEAVAMAISLDGQEKELVAYTTGKGGPSELNEYLKQRLPHYMVPNYYVQLSAFPLNNNGKIDRKALPMPQERFHQIKKAFAGPVSDIEKILVGIWQNILNVECVGIDDNFFDLGGTSLMVMRVVKQINELTAANLRVAILYQSPTIRQLAQIIEKTDSGNISPIVLLKTGTGTPLFIFPPWSSYPTIFNEFVRHFQGENPLYGVIYTEDTEHFPFRDVQDYARYIITHIKILHPSGPYGLLGYSLGARTILEVAIQLQQAGDKVDLLGVISHYPSFPPKKLFLSRRALDEIRVFWNINFDLKLKYLINRFPYFLKMVLKGNNNIQEIIVEIDTQKKILALHEAYQPDQRYHGDVVIIYEVSPDGDPSEYEKIQVYRNYIFKKLWRQHVTGDIIMKNIECKHIDFFKKPAVTEVVGVVQPFLK